MCRKIGQRGSVTRYTVFDTLWGAFGFVEEANRLIATYLPRSRRDIVRAIHAYWPQSLEAPDLLPRFRQAVRNYFEAKRTDFSVEVDPSRLPPFYRLVLEACRRIPYGQTASYADLARAVGKPNAVRAVGAAMAHNPLPLVVPCHRVLRSDGTIGGFSSSRGVLEKIRLLRLENDDFTVRGQEAAFRKGPGITCNRLRRAQGTRRIAAPV